MPSLKDLKFSGKDVIEGSFEDLPEQIGSRRQNLYPGPYRASFPEAKELTNAWDITKTTIGDSDREVERVMLKLRDEAALTIRQAVDKGSIGKTFNTMISNVERARGKDKTKLASDLDYVLVAAGADKKPTTNSGYIETANKVLPGKEIGFDIEWSYSCNKKKPIRIDETDEQGNPTGKTVVCDGKDGHPAEQRGCGKRYYQGQLSSLKMMDVDEATGEESYPNSIGCECGAVLFAQEQMSNYRK